MTARGTHGTPLDHPFDPKLDLLLERVVDVPPALIWLAWTSPEHLKQWFTPAPWQTVDCTIDLRPGGLFRTVMRSPEGQEFTNIGCYLEVVENRRLAWTNALGAGYRPVEQPAGCPGETFSFTATISLQAQGGGTNFTALVLHASEEHRQRHADMGFHDGWGTALDQLLAMVKRL